MAIFRDNIKGGALTETTFLVLLALYQPNHGYGIMQFIEGETGGRVTLGAGTLYGAINALAAKNWIAPTGDSKDSKKKEYLITAQGKRKAEEESQRMGAVLKLAQAIIRRERNE